MKLEKNELIIIKGGAITSAMLTALARIFGTVIEVGRMIGTSIRRVVKKKYC